MNEIREILRAWEKAGRGGRRAVLATIVNASGSTYRRPGARMLIFDDGETLGLLSGGCLEGDLAERSRSVLDSGVARTVVYDMSAQEDLVWGLGLGCAGTVHVLLERLPDSDATAHLSFLAECVLGRRHGVLATVFRSDVPERTIVGRRRMLFPGDDVSGSSGDPRLDDELAGEMLAVGESGRGAVRSYERPGGRVDVLIESIEPPVPLAVFGGGPDAQPLVRLASSLGWQVTVVDHRPAFATRDRFPEAHAVVPANGDPVPPQLSLDARTVAVVMTHKFRTDIELIERLLPSPVRYIGLLGPKARTEQLLEALRERASIPDEPRLDRLYAPIGLDIGAETPEEIALSALSEIQAVLTGRRGGFLRDREGPLHDRNG